LKEKAQALQLRSTITLTWIINWNDDAARGASRRFIENAFDAEFYDRHVNNEFEGLAWRCKEKDEYYIDADSVIMQFVDENDEVALWSIEKSSVRACSTTHALYVMSRNL